MATKQVIALYRSTLRTLYRTAPRPARFNLIRLYCPQLRQLLLDTKRDLSEKEATISRTLLLLSHSPSLIHSLSSLSYHHHPHPFHHSKNSRRLTNPPPTPSWNPQAPEAAAKGLEAARRKWQGDLATGFGEMAMDGVEQLVRGAEKAKGVVLGRIEREGKGRMGRRIEREGKGRMGRR